MYKYNTRRSNIYAYLNIMLEEIAKKEKNYEAVCQNLLEVIITCMLRNSSLSIIQSSNELLNRECAHIQNYLNANYAENITLDTLASLISPTPVKRVGLRVFCLSFQAFSAGFA